MRTYYVHNVPLNTYLCACSGVHRHVAYYSLTPNFRVAVCSSIRWIIERCLGASSFRPFFVVCQLNNRTLPFARSITSSCILIFFLGWKTSSRVPKFAWSANLVYASITSTFKTYRMVLQLVSLGEINHMQYSILNREHVFLKHLFTYVFEYTLSSLKEE